MPGDVKSEIVGRLSSMSAQELIDQAFDRLTTQTGFVDRPMQRQLAHLLGDCIGGASTGAFEAPTGLGKSLATLVPAFAHAIDSGKRTIVATYTNVLAEQYWRNDMPLARSLFDEPELVKTQFLIGRQRYACQAIIGEGGDKTMREFVQYAKLGVESEFRKFVHKSARELSQLWQSVAVPPVCPARLCPKYHDCWYYAARRGAERAHVIVTNHSVVIQDALLRQASKGELSLLGEYDFLILDEAHDFPQAAINGLEFELSSAKAQLVVSVARRLQGTLQVASMDAGVPHIWNQLCDDFVEGLQKVAGGLGREHGDGILLATPGALADHPQVKNRIQARAIPEAKALADSAASHTGAFVRNVEQTLRSWKENGYAKSEDQDAVRNYLMYLGEFGEGCRALFQETESDLVSVTYASGGFKPSFPGSRGFEPTPIIRRDLVHLAEPLQGLLWDVKPYACLSATLAVDGNFEFFRRMTGVEPDYEEILPSPFDFSQQAALYVPKAGVIPDPARARAENSEDAYYQALAHEITAILDAMGGRTLVLFHSRKEMEGVHQLMAKRDSPIYIQRSGGAASTGEKFLQDVGSSMFAVRSFWTGFDAPGETLSCVVLVRVPFEVPIDPPAVARMAWLQSMGLDAFATYSLPQAKMMMRQGAGRLIRRDTDKGVICLLDPRLRTKGYGEQIFENMPPGMKFFDDIHDAVAHVGIGS